jgi:hypothetical protein
MDEISKYKEYLQIVGSLSNLFSDSNTPYLYYRIAEKMFCKAFFADDLSRADVSYDACKDFVGIGLKTFLRNNNNSIQKIAEFNKDLPLYKDFKEKDKIIKISELRNKRLELANNLYNINDSLYHCVVRDKNKFFIYEEEIKSIDISNIKIIRKNSSSILFEDGNYEYSFSLSKSTLMKRFLTNSFIDEFEIKILLDPLEELYSLVDSKNVLINTKYIDSVYLPLYGSSGKVYTNSGLNQWNAKGRDRNCDEIYIPIPSEFYKYKPNFFPNKDIIFFLKLPNKKIIQAKICQENKKALMSNPNKDLGRWLLRDIFKLKEGTLVTNELLDLYGIDSVRIDKVSNSEYEINFSKKGSFEEFINNFKL